MLKVRFIALEQGSRRIIHFSPKLIKTKQNASWVQNNSVYGETGWLTDGDAWLRRGRVQVRGAAIRTATNSFS
jgi:hypothetical protein